MSTNNRNKYAEDAGSYTIYLGNKMGLIPAESKNGNYEVVIYRSKWTVVILLMFRSHLSHGDFCIESICKC